MPSQNGNGGRGGRWGSGAKPDSDIENLVRQGQERLKRILPSGDLRSVIVLAVLRLHDERSAQSRLDDVLGSETRNAVAKHELIEIIRTTKDRVPLRDTLVTDAGRQLDVGSLVPIQKGRKLVEQEIFAEAAEKVRVFGIELLDIRFKRINYNESVRPKIYDRMISERRQIAERFLSEGNGEAARIRGNRVRDLNKIQSEAYRQVEEIRGVADAKATEIYAKAYNQSPEAVAFYEFTRTMQS
ncbi:MAG: SPFH domain-containing protein, partial [Rhodoplanes sp.]